MDFTNKRVLITGGSRGIGRATAIAFAEAGARVAINFHSDKNAASQAVEMLPGEGHFAVRADISHPEAVEQLLNAVVQEMEGLDILVNNAGLFFAHPIDGSSYEEWQSAWQRTLNTNLLGAANLCYCAAQQMMKQGGGRIVNVSSRGAYRGEPGQPAYGASKAGMNAMSQSLAQALAPYNIFVGAVAPGFVETDMTRELLDSEAGAGLRNQSPTGRVAQPEEVAHCILFLASERAAFTTGCVLDVNGASYLH